MNRDGFSSGCLPAAMHSLLIQEFGIRTEMAYADSMQMRGEVPHKALRNIDNIVLPVALGIIISLAVVFARRKNRENVSLAVFILLGVLCNTAICAGLSGVLTAIRRESAGLCFCGNSAGHPFF